MCHKQTLCGKGTTYWTLEQHTHLIKLLFLAVIFIKLILWACILVDLEMYHIHGNVNKFELSSSVNKSCIKFKVVAKITSDLFISITNENIPVRQIQNHVMVHLENYNGK